MASIKKIVGKNGVSYKITVAAGSTGTGKQIRHYMTWKPSKPMAESRMDKEAQRAAFEFEQQIERGFLVDDRRTFKEYAEYVIELKGRQGRSPNTLETYRRHLAKVVPYIGDFKLRDIRPQHLNALYEKLTQIYKPNLLEAKVDFSSILAERGETMKDFAALAGVTPQTIKKIIDGGAVKAHIADQVAAVVETKRDRLFRTVEANQAYKDSYIKRVHSFLHGVLKQGEKEMLVFYNAADRVETPKADPPAAEWLQPEEVHALLDALDKEHIRFRAFFHLLIVTGARKGEILSLRWNEIDYTKRRIFIDSSLSVQGKQGKKDGPTKTRRTRYVTIPAETVDLLQQYRKWHTELKLLNGDRWAGGNYVFTNYSGESVNPCTVNYWLHRICDTHGLRRIKVHSLRHTAASIMISNGIDIVTVSKMLGHASPSMTMNIYSHIIDEAQQAATESVADVLLRRKAK